MPMPEIIKKDPYLKQYEGIIEKRMHLILNSLEDIRSRAGSLSGFALGHLYFGTQKMDKGWVFREWAPNATGIFLIGTFSNWEEHSKFSFKKISAGVWELIVPFSDIRHEDLYKLSMYWQGGYGERIPVWAERVVQDPDTLIFNAQIWDPEIKYKWKFDQAGNTGDAPLIYEAHIGMATEEYRIGTYDEFRESMLPRIVNAGYNTLQLMAIQEHPYYGSFGYHVSGFFAPSSRFGTPESLKRLIDEAHGAGLRVIMDIVHSHAVKNVVEGPGLYDGTTYQFFHEGTRGNHIAWDSLCFNYNKKEVIHFLLSNIQYWLKVFKFDGFRFDGVTSMLYYDHGLGRNFTNYDMYFDGQQDEDAIVYLALANELVHEIRPAGVTIAEEMSGYPGLAAPVKEGGIGFSYRMAMGMPDYWIKIIKELPDEKWNTEEIYYELTNKRPEEKTVGYAESHDQALVGDKTIIFRLMDKTMYFNMNKLDENIIVERGIALHKMIRLVTIGTSGNAYLNFMGNEFGHPEWIDFPRQENNWSYKYARRQWSLPENKDLRFHFLADFDKEMLQIIKFYSVLSKHSPVKKHIVISDQVLAFERGNLLFVFNFNPLNSFPNYGIRCSPGKYEVILDTDSIAFGGQGRVDHSIIYRAVPEKSFYPDYMLRIYLPSRTALVFKREKVRSVHDQA